MSQDKGSQLKISHSQFLGLVYHDLFEYPLTEEELEFWQIGTSQNPTHKVEKTGPFCHLPGRGNTVLKRGAKTGPSERKWQIAKRAARVLSLLPTVKFVGVTGGLSMGSAYEEDDIDLFIVTSVDSLWITRALSFVLLKLLRFKMRTPGGTDIRDKLCLNLWVDWANLSFSDRQDVYTAHEILQLKPLFDRGAVFEKFLRKNSWVWEFFPMAQPSFKRKGKKSIPAVLFEVLLSSFFRILDPLAYKLQLYYMEERKTSEEVTKGRASFHLYPWHSSVPSLFVSRLEKLSRRSERKPNHYQISD